jgi:2-dehydropantoate 2-reductase
MKILVYGIGGAGGYFGAKLAKAGYEVTMVARGKHLDSIRKNGLEIESINGNFRIFPKLATDNLKDIPKQDLVILGVKSWQIEEVAISLRPILGEETMVLPLQNGADNVEKLIKILPQKNVLAGLCKIVSFIESPGKIKHASFEPLITFGEIDNIMSPRIKKVNEIFNNSEITNNIPEDIQLEIWKKFLYIVTISGIGGLTRVPIEKIVESDYLFDLMQKTALEILGVANAKNVALSLEHIEEVFSVIQQQPLGTTASTQRDIMDGKPSELQNFNGYIVNEGTRLGIPTPINRFIYECLLPMENEARNR